MRNVYNAQKYITQAKVQIKFENIIQLGRNFETKSNKVFIYRQPDFTS